MPILPIMVGLWRYVQLELEKRDIEIEVACLIYSKSSTLDNSPLIHPYHDGVQPSFRKLNSSISFGKRVSP